MTIRCFIKRTQGDKKTRRQGGRHFMPPLSAGERYSSVPWQGRLCSAFLVEIREAAAKCELWLLTADLFSQPDCQRPYGEEQEQ